MLLKLLPYPTKSEQDTKLSRYIHGYMRKQNAVKFDYRYITKVCIHALLSLKITICFECK